MVEPGSVNAEQPYFSAFLPIVPEELADFGEDLIVELGTASGRAGPRDGGEVRRPQLELQGAGVETVFAQAPPDLLGQVRERGFELLDVGGVPVEGVFVADGLGIGVLADVAVEPAAGILALCLAG